MYLGNKLHVYFLKRAITLVCIADDTQTLHTGLAENFAKIQIINQWFWRISLESWSFIRA